MAKKSTSSSTTKSSTKGSTGTVKSSIPNTAGGTVPVRNKPLIKRK